MKKVKLGVIFACVALLLSACGKSSAVEYTEKQIDAIDPIITEKSSEDIEFAEQFYNSLSKKERKQVENVSKLKYYLAAESLLEAINTYNDQISTYNKSVETTSTTDESIRALISEIDKSGIYDQKAYDQNKITALITAATEAEKSVGESKKKKAKDTPKFEDISSYSDREIEDLTAEMENQISEIEKEIKKMDKTVEKTETSDNNAVLEDLQKKYKSAKKSVEILKQITAPTQDLVLSKLVGMEGITDISTATAENDPNGRLNQDGGYTAHIFFRIGSITDAGEGTAIDLGTAGGGSIEVYPTEAAANQRESELAAITESGYGSHKKLGTMIVRISDKLSADDQKAWEEKIISALTKVS